MEYANLGRTSARVSRLCLGTMNFGPVTDEAESLRIIDHAVGSGINFLDTADVYGSGPFGDHYGWSEEVLGNWVAAHGPAARDTLVLATKFVMPMGTAPNDRGLSAIHIRKAVEASLRRMQTDRIDLYQMHYLDRTANLAEVFEAFSVLRQQGKVIYFGSCNFAGWTLARYQEYALSRGSLGLVSEQAYYNLASRGVEMELIPAIEHYGLGLITYSPLGDGLLGGILAKQDRSRSNLHATSLVGRRLEQLERYEALARELGIGPGTLAIAWLLSRPGVTAPIIGPRTMDHLEGALQALEVTLDAQTLATLDQIWPGPGGEAPEVYASWHP